MMIATLESIELSKNELIAEPLAHTLAIGRNITVFSVKESVKTLTLKTGNKFHYHNELYEIMNTYKVQGKTDHIKFNCVLR